MSKNKIAKLLLALGIGAVTAASGLAVTACAPAGDPNGGQQNEQTTYHVTFNMNHADTSGAPAAKDTNSEGKVTAPTDPGARSDGQVFDGWWTEATGGAKFDFNTKITQDTTLYAHWKTAGTGGTGGGEGEQPGGGGGTGGGQPADPSTAPTVNIVLGGTTTALNDVLEKGADDKWHFKASALTGDGNTLPSSVLGTLTAKQEFKGWFKEATHQTAFDFTAAVEVATLNIYARVLEEVVTAFDYASAPTKGSDSAPNPEYKQGIFTLEAGKMGTESKKFNNANTDCINTQGKTITIEPTGEDITISFGVASGSSGGTDNPLSVKIHKVNADGTKEDITPVVGDTWHNAPKDDVGATCTISGLSAGKYEITNVKASGSGSGSLLVFNLTVTSKLPVGKADHIEVVGGTRDYLIGDSFSSTGMEAYMVFDNGRKDPIALPDNNASNLDLTTPGVHEITFTYEDDNNDPYTGKIEITLWQLKTLKIVANELLEYTPLVYMTGEKFETGRISVMATGEYGGNTKEFYKVPAAVATIAYSNNTELNNLTAGVKTITATATDDAKGTETVENATFTYYVIDKLPAKTASVYAEIAPSADTALTGDKIGTLKESGQANSEDNPYQFKTVQQAIDFFNAMNLDEAVTKYINLGAGTYKEKLYVDIPNLVIMGAGVVESGTDTPIGTEAPGVPNSDSKTWQWKSTISYDAIMNKPDGAGNLWNSDNSATIYITAAAKNFMMNGVAVVNENNTAEKVDAHAGDDQALALYSEADQSVYSMCSFSSYQDTVQLKNGRHLLISCYIEGATDFIYGDNSTSYFYKCQIHCLDHVSNIGKESTELAAKADGGYITAFKGGDSDAHVEYGAVFDWCEFTATQTEYDKGGKWAIARPWADYSSVAILNSKLGKHIAKNSALDAAKNARLSNGLLKKDIPNTVKTYEYNNSGLSADNSGAFTAEEIAAGVTGITFLADENAAKKFILFKETFGQGDFSADCEIFKATNGADTGKEVKYDADWLSAAPKQGAVIMVYKVGTGGEETDVLMADKVVYTTTQLDAAAIKKIVTDAKYAGLAADEELGDVFTDRDLATGKVESAQSLEANQTYKFYVKIDKVTGQITKNYTYSYNGLKADIDAAGKGSADKEPLTDAYFKAGSDYDNSWIHVAGASDITPKNTGISGAKAIHRTGNKAIEIKNLGLKVTFKGKGELVIKFGSTGDSNTSALALLDSNGDYVEGTITGGSKTEKVDNSFKVTGKQADDEVTFKINAAGTYYIVGDASVTGCSRETRIFEIKMTDTFAPEA